MTTKLNAKARLRRVDSYGSKGMTGDYTEVAMWERACVEGKLVRNWDLGCLLMQYRGSNVPHGRRRDGSWSAKHNGVKLKRKGMLLSLSDYGSPDSMMGEYTEMAMWEEAITHSITCQQWHDGAFTLVQGGFHNRYERQPDYSWSQARTKYSDK